MKIRQKGRRIAAFFLAAVMLFGGAVGNYVPAVKAEQTDQMEKEGMVLSSDYTLTKDMTVDHLTIQDAVLDLNGFRLEVTGDLIQNAGILKVNTGELLCRGNYVAGRDARLLMKNFEDRVMVEGDFTYSAAAGTLAAGTGKPSATTGSGYRYE